MTRRPHSAVRLGTVGAVLALSATLAACGGSASDGTVEGPVVVITPPRSPVPDASDSPDSPDGEPDSADDPNAPEVIATVASGLEVPWGLDFLPDGDAIVTERDSERVLRITGPEHTVTQVGTIDLASPGGEGGLLGVAVSPDFANDSLLFFYATTDTDNRVVQATLTDAGLGPVEDVFTGIPNGPIHDGGRLAFGPDGDLYVSTGEGGDIGRAQDPGSLGGKILRITPFGQPAPDNPSGTAVFTSGHRNVQGLAFSDDGQLWASEFGENTYDELNRIDAGSDYGRPLVEGDGGTDQGFVDPVHEWSTDEASPSGLAYVDGNLWMAALKGSRLWKIPVGTDDTIDEPQDYFVGDYGRMRTVALAPTAHPVGHHQQPRDGRGEPTEGDDRILAIQPHG